MHLFGLKTIFSTNKFHESLNIKIMKKQMLKKNESMKLCDIKPIKVIYQILLNQKIIDFIAQKHEYPNNLADYFFK